MSGVVGKVSTIAIVDDDKSARATMSSFVRSLGFDASAFGSAEEYLRSPQRYRSLCLISDVQMPGMSGLDLQTRLAAQGLHMPTIFITAFPDDKSALGRWLRALCSVWTNHLKEKSCCAAST